MGRDLAFSPDGNHVAVFAKRERGREPAAVRRPHGGSTHHRDGTSSSRSRPAWSPDGKRIAFAGDRNGQFDIFEVELETRQGTQRHRRRDLRRRAGVLPGRQVDRLQLGDRASDTQLFRLDLADPSKRYQLTTGDTNDNDAVFSPDGKRVYYTADRAGIDNIVGITLATGDIRQYTNVVTGCFMPTVLSEPDGTDRLVYSGYWRGRFDLYTDRGDGAGRRGRDDGHRRGPARRRRSCRSSSPTSR